MFLLCVAFLCYTIVNNIGLQLKSHLFESLGITIAMSDLPYKMINGTRNTKN